MLEPVVSSEQVRLTELKDLCSIIRSGSYRITDRALCKVPVGNSGEIGHLWPASMHATTYRAWTLHITADSLPYS